MITGADVFLYAENQLELQSSADDGVDQFSSVFSRDACVVVVMFRENWGKTKWTGIEEHAIKARAFNEGGQQFLKFVRLDESPLPVWVDPTRLWTDLCRFGKEGLAAVLSELVRARGGIARQPTAEERAAEVDRRRAFASDRTSFLESSNGVEAATASARQVIRELEKLAPRIGATFQTFPNHDVGVIRKHGFSVRIGWQPRIINSLRDTALEISVFEMRPGWITPPRWREGERELAHHQMAFELLESGDQVWRAVRNGSLFTCQQLADWIAMRLLDASEPKD